MTITIPLARTSLLLLATTVGVASADPTFFNATADALKIEATMPNGKIEKRSISAGDQGVSSEYFLVAPGVESVGVEIKDDMGASLAKVKAGKDDVHLIVRDAKGVRLVYAGRKGGTSDTPRAAVFMNTTGESLTVDLFGMNGVGAHKGISPGPAFDMKKIVKLDPAQGEVHSQLSKQYEEKGLLAPRKAPGTTSRAQAPAAPPEDTSGVISVDAISDALSAVPSELRSAAPGLMVLAQVPLSRFLRVPTRHSHAEWLQRVGCLSADLLVCDTGSRVLAVVDIRPVDERRLLCADAALDREHVALVVDEPAAVADGFRHLLLVSREAVLAPISGRKEITRLGKVPLRFVTGCIGLGGRDSVGARADELRRPIVNPHGAAVPFDVEPCVGVFAFGVAARREIPEPGVAGQRIGSGCRRGRLRECPCGKQHERDDAH